MKLVLREVDSQAAIDLWQEWADDGEVLIAPPLFRPETFSALRRSVYTGRLTSEQGEQAYSSLERLAVELREPLELYRVAWQLAQRFQRPTVYDCCYLALANIVGCDFWTADQRLANAVGSQVGTLNLLAG